MSRRTSRTSKNLGKKKTGSGKSRVWTPDMGPGVYDFEKGEFTPAPAAADTAPADPAAASGPDTAQPQPQPEAEEEEGEVTVVHDVPGPGNIPVTVTVTGDDALPGTASLSFKELAQLAGMAGLETPPGTDEILEGVLVGEEVTAARQLLATAEDRGETPLDLAHAYAYLDSVHKALGRQVKRTREQAEKLFAAAQLVAGVKALEVMADDGGPAVATIHIQEVKSDLAWDMAAVRKFCGEHAETELYQEVLPGALELNDVVAYIAMTHPDYVKTKVREAYLKRLQSEVGEDGCKADPKTGELVKLATITPGERKGAFVTTYAKEGNGRPGGKQRIEQLFRAGVMGDVLALGAAEPGPDAG